MVFCLLMLLLRASALANAFQVVASPRTSRVQMFPTAHTPQMKELSAPSLPRRAVWMKQATLMWLAAALLGPCCDNLHSSQGVLHYAADSIAGPPLLVELCFGNLRLETCWWVPCAFGGAGVVLGAAHPLLDRAWGSGLPRVPGWPVTLAAIASFLLCYGLSGWLAAAHGGTHLLAVDLPLLGAAAASFLIFERSKGGLLMMFLLATIGPCVEIGLINQLHLYAYTHPDFLGIPSWIPWVYAAGGPANGALGRQVLHELTMREPKAGD